MVDNNNETQVPSITIDGVQISVDELPEGDARRWFAQVQHLTQKKAGQVFEEKNYLLSLIKIQSSMCLKSAIECEKVISICDYKLLDLQV